MQKSKLKYLVMVGAMAICSLVSPLVNSVWADSNSMTVSPPYQKIILTPGETYEGSLNVSNATNSTRPLKYAVEVGSYSQKKNENSKDDYGTVDHVSVSSYNQIMEWIKLDKENGTVEPGEDEEIGYTIEVPKNAPGGGQYATILVIDETTSGVPGEGNIGIDQKFQFASIIYAEVAGETKQEGEISENSIPGFLLQGPIEATSMVRNKGNVHTDAEYTFQVWPLFSDEEICTNEEKPETSLILPETERYHTQSCDVPSFGIFKVKQSIKIFGETSIVERTVIVCPLWLLFVILFVVIAIIIWVFTRIKRSKKRKNTTSDEETQG